MYTRAQWIYHARVCEYVRESVRICTHAVSEHVTRVCVDLHVSVCECVHMCGVKCCVCVGERVESSVRLCTYGCSENIACACLNMYMRASEYIFQVCSGHVMGMCVNMCMRACDESVQIHTYVCSVQICVQ